MAPTFDVIVIGAGLAGASTAYHLMRQGAGDVLLLEREAQAGIHSSGRNAAIARQAVADAEIARLAKESVSWMGEPDASWSGSRSLLEASGLLLFESTRQGGLDAVRQACESAVVPLETLDAQAAVRMQPLLRGATISSAALSPSDGVVDVHALLTGFLRGFEALGGRLQLDRDCVGFDRKSNRLEGVVTDRERLAAGSVVIAAGAWAAELGKRAGCPPLPLRTTRRHLFVSEPVAAPPGPTTWRLDEEIYFRREGRGLLLSPCDITDHPAATPTTSLEAREMLLSKLEKGFPAMQDLGIRSSWAGLRILTRDGRHLLGPDESMEGLHWAAGLGGHGVTTAWAAGRIVAQGICDGTLDPAFRPRRFDDGRNASPLQ